MIKLAINNADGSPYLTEHFNSMAEAEAWLAIEETRPYWKPHRLAEFFDLSKPKPSKEEEDAKIAKQERIQALRDKHAAMKPADLDTIVEMRQAFFELHEILGIK